MLAFKRVLSSYDIDVVPDRDLSAMMVPDQDGDMKVAYNKLWTHFGRGGPPVCLSVCLSARLPVCPSVFRPPPPPSLCATACVSVCLCLCLSVCLSV